MDLDLDAGRAPAVAEAPWRLSSRVAAGSEDGWTGLPGMVSPHARSSWSSSPPPPPGEGEEEEEDDEWRPAPPAAAVEGAADDGVAEVPCGLQSLSTFSTWACAYKNLSEILHDRWRSRQI